MQCATQKSLALPLESECRLSLEDCGKGKTLNKHTIAMP